MKKTPELLVLALDGAVPAEVRSLLAAGRLPNIRQVVDGGVWLGDCRPPFPTITPTCWTSFATGTTPADHGATCQDFHPPGSPAGQLLSAYTAENTSGERFWEAAARAGKRSLVVQVPSSGPRRSDLVYQIAGASCSAIRAASPGAPTVPASVEVPAAYIDVPAGSHGRQTVSLPVQPRRAAPFTWVVELSKGFVHIRCDQGMVHAKAGAWSEPFCRSLLRNNGISSPHWFRARLFAADPDTGRLHLYISESGLPSDFAAPAELGRALDEIPLVPASHGHSGFLSSLDTANAYLEAEGQAFEWQLAAIERGVALAEPHIIATYSVYLDSLNHAFRNVVEGLTDATDQERAEVTELYHRGYELADWFVGRMLGYADKDTTVLLLSDHGSVGYTEVFDPVPVLEAAGLLKVTQTAGGEPAVDYTSSAVFPASSCHIYANLKGREPAGTVEPAEYDSVVQRTIDALTAARSESGVAPVAFALRRDEAGLVGLGGERTGDVVYGLRGSRVGGHIGGVHACQIPTARTATGDIRALGVLSGPAIRRGITIEQPVSLWDLAPTLAAAVGFPPPADSTGRVVRQALKR